MKYFLDTEFLEGTQRTWFGQTKPTIDLISIGIVCEDGREYYAISKDFNLKEAWNRYDVKTMTNLKGDSDTNKIKVYWLRDNVLKPIWKELIEKERHYYLEMFKRINVWTKYIDDDYYKFTHKEFKRLLNKYGKTNKQIAEEVIEFCKLIEGEPLMWVKSGHEIVNIGRENTYTNPTFGIDYIGKRTAPQFYGYYSDYDWVVFCWLFGRMNDLPKGFPMYCIDLQQTLDELQESENVSYEHELNCNGVTVNSLKIIENLSDYPKQTNEHNALADARWNYELYKFLNTL